MKKAPLKRKTPLRQVNRKRREKERERSYGPPGRREWVAQQPCIVWDCKNRPCENAHVNPEGHPSGMGRKGDYTQIVPMCHDHHQELHQIGERTFEDRHELDLGFKAILTEDGWQAFERRHAK